MAKAQANFLQEVKEQYEDYPYPPRDPQAEKIGLMAPYIDIPNRLNHYCFGGRRDFRKRFRVLIAGGGTGDSSVYMAEQYGTLGAEIVHIDLSKASIAIAKERLKMRGLEGKVTFLHASLLDIPKMGLGKFDYINCSGVLHHLANPEEGLASLESSLEPDGAIGIMLYGKYGRHGIYPMQETLAIATKHVSSRAKKIEFARKIISNLPNNNWFYLTKNIFQWDLGTDNGFYDLLLHPQDRAYTVPELYEFTRSAKLNYLSFQDDCTSGASLYDPKRFIHDSEVLDELHKLELEERQALAELIASNISKHTFYTTRNPISEPDVNDENFIPIVNYAFSANMKTLLKMVITATDENIMCTNQKGNHAIIIGVFPTTAALIIAIDGSRTIRQILDDVSSASKIDREEVKDHFHHLYEDLRAHDIIFMRHSSIPAYVSLDEIHNETLRRTQNKN